MAGAIGGGGLRSGTRYGYQRWEPAVMACVIVLVCLVQGIQYVGDVCRKALYMEMRDGTGSTSPT